jgi:hypothetical protein
MTPPFCMAASMSESASTTQPCARSMPVLSSNQLGRAAFNPHAIG